MTDGDSLCFSVTFTNLPIVILQGEFGYDYQEGAVHMYHPDSVGCMNDMLAKIKWRGGSTNVAGKNKRNYTLKFINENLGTKVQYFLHTCKFFRVFLNDNESYYWLRS